MDAASFRARLSRRDFVQGVAVAGLALQAGCGRLPFQAQRTRVPRIGLLTSGGPEPVHEAFREGLREHGYAEGENIVTEWRYAELKLERLPALADDLVGLPVDLIVGVTTPAIHAAKNATTTIPIVMVLSTDPVASGFVTSLAQPGGHVTGLSMLSAGISGKRLDLLKELVPRVSHVAALRNPSNPANAFDWTQTGEAAQRMGLSLRSVEARSPEELDAAFEAATSGGADALIVLQDTLFFFNRARIVELAAQSRLPALYPQREFVVLGGLIAYGTSIAALFRRAAYYVDRILKGSRPADLPVEQPMHFDLALNLRTAQALGLTIPQHVLLQATEIVQ